MEKIPTAEEFLSKNIDYVLEKDCKEDVEYAMIEFAKLHVQAALKEASEKALMKDMNEDCHFEDEDGNFPDMYVIDRDSILNSYPLDKIK